MRRGEWLGLGGAGGSASARASRCDSSPPTSSAGTAPAGSRLHDDMSPVCAARHERNEKLSGKKNKRVAMEKPSTVSPKKVSSLLKPHGGRGCCLIPSFACSRPDARRRSLRCPTSDRAFGPSTSPPRARLRR
eukprot:4082452-Prymnesium_polylepis.1